MVSRALALVKACLLVPGSWGEWVASGVNRPPKGVEGCVITSYSIHYTKLYDGKPLLPEEFVRIHNSYIVNVNFIKKLIKTDQWSVVMETGITLPVARRKRADFMDIMNKIVGNSKE